MYLRRDGERMPEACLPGAHGGPRGGAVSIPEVWQVVRAWCPPPGLALRHVCGGSPCPCGGDVPEVVAGYTCAGVVPLACLRGLAVLMVAPWWCGGYVGGVAGGAGVVSTPGAVVNLRGGLALSPGLACGAHGVARGGGPWVCLRRGPLALAVMTRRGWWRGILARG